MKCAVVGIPLVLAALGACASEDGKDVPGEPAPAPVAVATPLPMPRTATITAVTVKRLPAGAIAIDLAADHWPVRAVDPVLHIGSIELRDYTFPRANVLRFVADSEDVLAPGAVAFVQYGDDARSRVTLDASLEVSP